MTLYWNLRWFTSFSICCRLFAHFLCTMTVLVWPCRDKKTPPLGMEEELMMEVLCLIKNEDEFWWWSFSPHFSFDYGNAVHPAFGQVLPCLPICTPSRVSYTNKLFSYLSFCFTEFFQHQHRRTYALLSPKMCSAVSLTVNNACVKVFPFEPCL